MTITANPKRKLNSTSEGKVQAFIDGAGQPDLDEDVNMKPFIVRCHPAVLAKIDRAARRLSMSRSAFIISSAAERAERMEA